MLILFCGEDYGSVSWNPPIGDYQIFDWRVEHSDPNGTIRTQAFGPLKKATRPCRRFLIAPAPISLLFLCPHTPLSRCMPNQHRDATQVAYFICYSESRYKCIISLEMQTNLSFLNELEGPSKCL